MERIWSFINSWIHTKDVIKWIYENMSQYFPEPYEPFGVEINVKVDLSNYATKADLKNPAGTDTSKLAGKSDLVSLKVEINILDIDKLKNLPTNLSNFKSKADKLDIDKLLLIKCYW